MRTTLPPVKIDLPPSPARESNPHGPIPWGSPGNWVTNNDYPNSALRANQQGVVGFKVTVGTDGTVSACDISSSSGVASLDETTCWLLVRRARFRPATDANGEPVVGTWSSRMRWVLPDDPRSEPFEYGSHPVPGQSLIAFSIGTDGLASDCQIISGPDPAEFLPMFMPCNGQDIFPVYRDANGKPVVRRVRITIGVTVTGTQPAAPRKKKR
ncbi:MAG: energy transducer TonB [Novosphingobium sp.]|nr:energy transducer TonB [Novosphingobium sp.]